MRISNAKELFRVRNALRALGLEVVDEDRLKSDVLITDNRCMCASIPIIFADEVREDPLYNLFLIAKSIGKSSRLLIGIDPGKRIGLAFQFSDLPPFLEVRHTLENAVLRIVEVLDFAACAESVVKIGAGDPRNSELILKVLRERFRGKVEIQLVDEASTSSGGKKFGRDELSALRIMQREGRVIGGGKDRE